MFLFAVPSSFSIETPSQPVLSLFFLCRLFPICHVLNRLVSCHPVPSSSGLSLLVLPRSALQHPVPSLPGLSRLIVSCPKPFRLVSRRLVLFKFIYSHHALFSIDSRSILFRYILFWPSISKSSLFSPIPSHPVPPLPVHPRPVTTRPTLTPSVPSCLAQSSSVLLVQSPTVTSHTTFLSNLSRSVQFCTIDFHSVLLNSIPSYPGWGSVELNGIGQVDDTGRDGRSVTSFPSPSPIPGPSITLKSRHIRWSFVFSTP